MVQLYNLFNALSKNISCRSPGKKNKGMEPMEPARVLAKDTKTNGTVVSSTGVCSPNKSKNFAAGYSKRGKKGLNQDRFIVWEEFGCQEDAIFCGVFDGHGPWGHLVARRVKKLLPLSLLCNWQQSVELNSLNLDNNLTFDESDIQFDMWKKSYSRTCAAVDQQLQQYTGIDSFYSGCTALTFVRQGDCMIVANVGDSRAVLATALDDGSLVATQLTTDHKPNLPHERKRIAQSRGKIFSCPDEPEVYRMWIPGERLKGPGLAVSRAFGDYYLKDFGLTPEPDVMQLNITPQDQFVILATDGVWDVMSNEVAVEIVASTPDRAQSAKRLVEYACYAWKRKGKAAVTDDITAICVFLHPPNAPQSAGNHTNVNG